MQGIAALASLLEAESASADPRDTNAGLPVMNEGYADHPYLLTTNDLGQ